MVTFDPVVLVLAGVVHGGGDQVLDHVRQRRSPIGDDLRRFTVRSQGRGEEPARGADIASPGHEHVDDLPVLVHRPVHVAPHPGDLT